MEKQNKKLDILTDKAFSRLILTSVLGIVVCVICLCSTTFAWFTKTVPSADNTITVADECLLSITVTKDGVALDDIENGVVLEAAVPYTVMLSLPPNAASGYCLVNAGETTYYTDYIARHTDPTSRTVSFTVIAETEQTVSFVARWGIYARDCDVQSGQLIIP